MILYYFMKYWWVVSTEIIVLAKPETGQEATL